MKLFSIIYAQTGAGKGTGTGCEASDYVPLNQIAQLVVDFSKILLPLGMLVFFVMLIMGGVKYLTSGGDMKSLASAKGTITFAFIGVVLLVAAFVILMLISNILIGNSTDIFDFQVDDIIKTLSGGDSNPCLTGPGLP